MAEGDECSAQRRTSGLPCRAVSRERIETGSNLLTFGETLGLFAFLPSAKLKLPAILVGLVDAFHRSVMTAIALVQLAKIGEAPVIHAAPALGDESQAIVHHSVSGRCFNAAFS